MNDIEMTEMLDCYDMINIIVKKNMYPIIKAYITDDPVIRERIDKIEEPILS